MERGFILKHPLKNVIVYFEKITFFLPFVIIVEFKLSEPMKDYHPLSPRKRGELDRCKSVSIIMDFTIENFTIKKRKLCKLLYI